MVPFQSLQAAKEQCGRIQTLFFFFFFFFFFFAARHTHAFGLFCSDNKSDSTRGTRAVWLGWLRWRRSNRYDFQPIRSRPFPAASQVPPARALVISMPHQGDDKNHSKPIEQTSQLRSREKKRGVRALFEPLLKVASVCVCVHVWGSSLAWVGFVCKRKSRKDACLSRRLTRSSDRRAGLRTLPRRSCQSDGSAHAHQSCTTLRSSPLFPSTVWLLMIQPPSKRVFPAPPSARRPAACLRRPAAQLLS